MSRWIGSIIFALLGFAMLVCGLQVPAHLRAVDGAVLHWAGAATPSLIDQGRLLVEDGQLGPAQLFAAAAQSAWIKNADELREATYDLARRRPELMLPGGVAPGGLGALLDSIPVPAQADSIRASARSQPFTEFIVRSDKRTESLELLARSPDPLVQALLRFRSLTNTVLFPSSASASGQALDAAVVICGWLAESGQLSTGLSNAVLGLASQALHTWQPEPLEQVLLDLMSLGQRFNWGQFAAFVRPIEDTETLRRLADLVRRGEGVPVLFSAVCLSGDAAGVARYLAGFGQTGLNDLRLSLVHGAGGVQELVRRQRRLCDSGFCARMAAITSSLKPLAGVWDYSWRRPALALAGKWFLYVAGAFLLAAALHCARRVAPLERPLEVRGFHLVRGVLFALGFLLIVLLLSEPFLSQGNPKAELPLRLRLSAVGSAIAAGTTGAKPTLMNEANLFALLLFFVLQALIYIACLVKLAEIRRQRLAPHIKLKLLENEDHLFDAGLYLGFVGTIISLILFSLGIVKPSLMAAYSSTSFGIIFVSGFKIFNLRPLRRKLLLESEAESTRLVSAAEPSYATPS